MTPLSPLHQDDTSICCEIQICWRNDILFHGESTWEIEIEDRICDIAIRKIIIFARIKLPCTATLVLISFRFRYWFASSLILCTHKSMTMRRRCTTIKPLFCDNTNSVFWYHEFYFVISNIFCDIKKSGVFFYINWFCDIKKSHLWYHKIYFWYKNYYEFLISQTWFCDITYSLLWYHKIDFLISLWLFYTNNS